MRSLKLTLDGLGSGDVKRKDVLCGLMKKVKVKYLAYIGSFNGVFSPLEIHRAKTDGVLPNGYSIHHVIPLCTRETTFDLNNMVVIDNRAHKFIHDCLITPVLKLCKEGESCSVWIPDMDRNMLITYESIMPFIESWKENEIRLGRMKSIKFLKQRERQYGW